MQEYVIGAREGNGRGEEVGGMREKGNAFVVRVQQKKIHGKSKTN